MKFYFLFDMFICNDILINFWFGGGYLLFLYVMDFFQVDFELFDL